MVAIGESIVDIFCVSIKNTQKKCLTFRSFFISLTQRGRHQWCLICCFPTLTGNVQLLIAAPHGNYPSCIKRGKNDIKLLSWILVMVCPPLSCMESYPCVVWVVSLQLQVRMYDITITSASEPLPVCSSNLSIVRLGYVH